MLTVRIQAIDGTGTSTLPDFQPCRLLIPCSSDFAPGREGATSWAAIEAKEQAESNAEASAVCADLARCPKILERLDKTLGDMGVAGERKLAQIIYLAVTSRFFDRPANVAIKGPSSSGKSYIVEIALRFFPAAAFYALTGLSDRALAYSTEPLRHRFLVVYEAAGMNSDFATYLIRSLLSEGRLRYETVESTKDGLVPRLIEREGPTGLITTTTSIRLHPENETRLISLSTTDTAEQTAAIFKALAEDIPQPDLSEWQALQTWLAASPSAVVIPFAPTLAKLVEPVAVRLRRDFKLLLTLIRAHTLLHQEAGSGTRMGV
jgi:hypothetical protein